MSEVEAPELYPGEDCDRGCLCPGYEIHARIYFPLLDLAEGTDVSWSSFLKIPPRELTGDLTFGTLVAEGLDVAGVRTDSGVPSPRWRARLGEALARPAEENPGDIIAGFWSEGGRLPPGQSIDRPRGLGGTVAEDARLRFFRLSPSYLTDPLAPGEPLGIFPTIAWPENRSWVLVRHPADYSVFISCDLRTYEALAAAGLDVARVNAEDIEELHIRKLGDIYHQHW